MKINVRNLSSSDPAGTGGCLNRVLIKASQIGLIGVVLLLGSCAEFEVVRNTDLAIDTYAPPPDALGVAETRAKHYWAKHHNEIGPDTRYLAVQSDVIFSDEIPNLYAKLVNSPGVNSGDLEDFENDNELNVYCVNIFDTRTNKLVEAAGYAVVDLPGLGTTAHFGTYSARYIGTGQ
jgi:hypothetical protein